MSRRRLRFPDLSPPEARLTHPVADRRSVSTAIESALAANEVVLGHRSCSAWPEGGYVMRKLIPRRSAGAGMIGGGGDGRGAATVTLLHPSCGFGPFGTLTA